MPYAPRTLLSPTTDLAATKAVYAALLGEPMVDEPYYLAWQVDDVHVGFAPDGGPQHVSGPTPIWDVADLDAAVIELSAAGASVVAEPMDVGGGARTALLADADGNPIGLRQA